MKKNYIYFIITLLLLSSILGENLRILENSSSYSDKEKNDDPEEAEEQKQIEEIRTKFFKNYNDEIVLRTEKDFLLVLKALNTVSNIEVSSLTSLKLDFNNIKFDWELFECLITKSFDKARFLNRVTISNYKGVYVPLLISTILKNKVIEYLMLDNVHQVESKEKIKASLIIDSLSLSNDTFRILELNSSTLDSSFYSKLKELTPNFTNLLAINIVKCGLNDEQLINAINFNSTAKYYSFDYNKLTDESFIYMLKVISNQMDKKIYVNSLKIGGNEITMTDSRIYDYLDNVGKLAYKQKDLSFYYLSFFIYFNPLKFDKQRVKELADKYNRMSLVY